jgi:hypothetical protein
VKWKLLRLALALVALTTAAACGHGIGDECVTSVDCSPSGDRMCDLSQPGGYCTVDGCDAKSCPSDSVCIRYFPEAYLTQECQVSCEDIGVALMSSPDCPMVPEGPNGVPPKVPAGRQDHCQPDEACLPLGAGAPKMGLCARRSFERRSCARSCGSDSDCRDGYECRPAGTHGTLPLLSSATATAKFCAPRPK